MKLSANWMAPAGHEGDDAALYDTVRAVALELCPALGISIPVGKDSMSMRTTWRENGVDHAVTAPLSLIVSAFAPVPDVRRVLTPLLVTDRGDTTLVWIDLGAGKRRLGGSALAQVYGQLGDVAPDLDEPSQLAAFFATIQALAASDRLLAYHDIADGGLFATLAEMAFAARCGLDIAIEGAGGDALGVLFAEELGAVVQIHAVDREAVRAQLDAAGLVHREIGAPAAGSAIRIRIDGDTVLDESRIDLHRAWSATTHELQRMRDDPEVVDQEYARILDVDDPASRRRSRSSRGVDIAASFIATGARPAIAILREQGVNGQVEMAAAFDRAGFDAFDVHMTDILAGRRSLAAFRGFVACGGFSYGDVLGAGEGWAKSILFNARARDDFAAFFAAAIRSRSACATVAR